MKNKILVLGTSSFAGASMVNFLLNKKYKVYGTYRRKKNQMYLPYLENKNLKNFKNYPIDFNKSPKKLEIIIKKLKPDYIIDFVSIAMVNQSWQFPKVYFDVNINYKLHIFQNLNAFNFIKKYILISTPEIFGDNKKTLKEESYIFNPSTPYAISKLGTELLLKCYAKRYNIPFVITRFTNFYGPGQPIYRLIPKILACIEKKIKFPLEGGGNSSRNFIYTFDFCNGIYKAMLKGKNFDTYHFSSNKYYKIKEIVKIICSMKKIDHRILIKKTKSRVGQDDIYKLNSNKTRKILKWKTIYSLQKGIQEIINYNKTRFKKFSKESLVYLDRNFK